MNHLSLQPMTPEDREGWPSWEHGDYLLYDPEFEAARRCVTAQEAFDVIDECCPGEVVIVNIDPRNLVNQNPE